MLSDPELDRYSRQLLVPGMDIEGQERLSASTVAIVGCGGLGCPLAMYLAAAGVGKLVLFDDDTVEHSNLPRQIAFTEQDVGLAKVQALAARLRAMNSALQVEVISERFSAARHSEQVARCDLVLDASDSRESRLEIEAATQEAGKPWIMGAAIQMSGQWVAFSPSRSEGCYRCLAPAATDEAAGGCARLGVLGPVVGAVAMQQATLAMMYLTASKVPWGQLTVMDFRTGEQQSLQLSRRADCTVCTS